MIQKVDLKKELKHLYAPPPKPVLVDVPPITFLAIDGTGDPNGREYGAAVEALFSVAYRIKFALKREAGLDPTVMPLESLWWADDPAVFLSGRRGEWRWTAMIAQPEAVTQELAARAIEDARAKADPSALSQLRLARMEEGLCAQVMHVGPFSTEGPVIAGLEAFIEQHGLSRRGKHHEIYLSDLRRTAPERRRTVIRQPVSPASEGRLS